MLMIGKRLCVLQACAYLLQSSETRHTITLIVIDMLVISISFSLFNLDDDARNHSFCLKENSMSQLMRLWYLSHLQSLRCSHT